MSNNVLVWVEIKDAQIRRSALETVGAGSELANKFGGGVEVILIGAKIEQDLCKTLSDVGATKIYTVEHEEYEYVEPARYVEAIKAVWEQLKPKAILMPATAFGKDISARLAGKLGAPLAADCTAIDVKDGVLVATRPVYAGKLLCDVGLVGEVSPIVTLRPNVWPVPEQVSAGNAEIVPVSAEISEVSKKVVVKETNYMTSEMPDVSEADIVVSGGRGMKGPENFAMLEELAKLLGGTVGASRSAVDAGWRDHQAQVGQTGKTITPNLYIACGISGATQHLAGMSSSKCIVAINKDPEANIFKVADYGIVGDLFKVVPVLTEEIKKLS